MHPRATAVRTTESSARPWWRSTTAVSLFSAAVAAVVTLAAAQIASDSAARTFYAEQRAEAYTDFLSTATEVITASTRPDPTAPAKLVPTALFDKLQNDWATIQLVGSERAQDTAGAFLREAAVSRSRGDMTGVLLARRIDFRDAAREDIEPSGWW